MEVTVFKYNDYKRYLRDLIAHQPKKGRGIRSELSEKLGCQIAHLSHVLNGKPDLTLEQAGKVNRFFGHSSDESHGFLLLVQLSRAGDEDTRQYFRSQLSELLARRLVIKNRLGLAQGLNADDQVTYYSAWYYAAVHILLTIPAFQSRRSLASKLALPIVKVNEVLEFLTRTGLAIAQGDRFVGGDTRIHLGNDSKLIARHHANWRLQAMHSLDIENPNDLHYSGVFSLSEADIARVKSLLIKKIEDVVDVVKSSKEEKLSAFCVDFFEVGSGAGRL